MTFFTSVLFFLILICVAQSQRDAHDSFHGVDGRDVTVHLFQWKWTDIANECEQYLGPNGFGAVRVNVLCFPKASLYSIDFTR